MVSGKKLEKRKHLLFKNPQAATSCKEKIQPVWKYVKVQFPERPLGAGSKSELIPIKPKNQKTQLYWQTVEEA